MKQTTKTSTNNQTFLERFRDLFNEKGCSQVELANAIGSARGTVATWLDGKTAPNVYMVKALAEYFSVSADYLLCISDTRSSDVNVKAAMEYTGLSEEAVEWLHIGLDDFECDGEGISEETKVQNLQVTSALIVDKAFTKIIQHLKKVSMESYFEKVLWILYSEYSECGSAEEEPEFRYAKSEDRDIVMENLIHVFQEQCPWDKEQIIAYVMGMDDDDKLAADVISAYLSAKESNELHQFHAAKAFNSYIDQIVAASARKAESRFAHLEELV